MIMNAKIDDTRYELYCQMLDSFDEGCRLVQEYDSVPHDYGAAILYQAESQIIHLVGHQPGITASEIAAAFHKTPSACSQLIRKLRKKGWLLQKRNHDNNREYQLYLTDEGKKIAEMIYERHRFITAFLTSLGVDEKIAAEDACRIEHVISEESFAALKEHIKL